MYIAYQKGELGDLRRKRMQFHATGVAGIPRLAPRFSVRGRVLARVHAANLISRFASLRPLPLSFLPPPPSSSVSLRPQRVLGTTPASSHEHTRAWCLPIAAWRIVPLMQCD